MKLRASLVALAALASVASASGLTLYEDITTKQIFTEPGENRQKLGSFVQENNLAEMMSKETKSTPVFAAKSQKLEFEGTHYFGYTSNNYREKNAYGTKSAGGFEFRRNYVQVKAYLTDKDYFRVTVDSTKELEASPTSSGSTSGYSTAYVKYAYLWLDKVPLIPNTGAEIGVVHRPWIDYEEHNSWYYRSFNKVAVEDKFSTAYTKYTAAVAPVLANNYQATAATYSSTTVGPDIINSADLGINLKTKTEYFTSEIGLLNGEGYHADKNAANQAGSNGMSFEYRLTGHIFGDGKKVGKYDRTKDSYANISVAGMVSKNHKDNNLAANDNAEYDRKWTMVHAVYNNPYFLVAAQYSKVNDDLNYPDSATTSLYDKELKVWSVNAEVRPVKDWTIIARYDNMDTKYKNANSATTNADSKYNDNKVGDATQTMVGAAYKYSKNISFIGTYKVVDAKDKTVVTAAQRNYAGAGATTVGDILDKRTFMLTTEVKW